MGKVQDLSLFIEARSIPVSDVCEHKGCADPVEGGTRFCKKHLQQSFKKRKLVCNRHGPEVYIYAIGPPSGDLVKIGRAKDVHARLRSLQGGSPVELAILGAFRDVMYTEPIIHEAFREYRAHGEWFNRAKPIELLIEHMSRGRKSKVWDMIHARCDVTPVKKHFLLSGDVTRYYKRSEDF